jgi:multimeric flavodoxin WrbA
MKILFINGSHRKNGSTKALLNETLSECKKSGVDCSFVDLADYEIKYCQAHDSEFCKTKGCVYKDGIEKILKQMEKADAIIIGSPVYMGSVTGKLKAFMDRTVILRRKDFRLSQKVGAAVAVGKVQGGGQEHTLSCIHHFLLGHDMTVVPDGKDTSHYGVVAISSYENDIYALKTAKNLARRVIEEIMLRGKK